MVFISNLVQGLAAVAVVFPFSSATPLQHQQPLIIPSSSSSHQPSPSSSPPSPLVATQSTSNSSTLRPIVLWHGLGDSSHSSGMRRIASDLSSTIFPGRTVYSLQIPYPSSSIDEESKAGWYGNASSQVTDAYTQLLQIPNINETGFDAIGFSQGGLFLRDYAQRYIEPKLKRLVTFGSPHMGISALIPCKNDFDFWCVLAKRTAERGVYTRWAQDNLIQVRACFGKFFFFKEGLG